MTREVDLPGVSRRDLLKGMGGAIALAIVGVGRTAELAYAGEPSSSLGNAGA